MGKQGVQPHGEVSSAVSGSQLGVKQVSSCLTYCKSCRLRNTMAAWIASTISSCPPANQPCWGFPPCPRSSRVLLWCGQTWGAQCCLGTQVLWFRACRRLPQPPSLPWPAGMCGWFLPRTRIPVGQQRPSHRGVYYQLHAESPDSLLLPLAGVN